MIPTVASLVALLLLKALVGELMAVGEREAQNRREITQNRREIRRLVERQAEDRQEIRRLSEALKLAEDREDRLSEELGRIRDRRKLFYYFFRSYINGSFSYISKLCLGSPDVYKRQR